MFKKMSVYFTLPLLLLLSNSWGNSSLQAAGSAPEGFVPGPDVIAGNMADLYEDGAVGTQRGLAMGITTCNGGNVPVDFFAIPGTNHPAAAQNLYRMSGGSGNNDRFEQIGQAWVKHTFGAEQANACNFGCQPGGDFTHLGVGCSDTYFASQSANQFDLGSRAWINPFTGVFSSAARDHTGHVHTATSHMLLVESNDLNTTMNPGATYYGELVYITPDEYAWCQTHPGECNMYNNASYLRYNVFGTTDFSFSAVGSPVRMIPAINAWTGATINPIEPEPGVDGRAFIAYKVTGPVAGVYHYEYALYNENLDRGIQSFSVPLGCAITLSNLGFHAPLNHPGFPNDGTQGNAGFSNAPWTSNQTTDAVSWSSETLAQNQNANAIRWGTLYNFRFDSDKPPLATNATIGFFKTGTPVTVAILAPNACDIAPSPTPTATATPTPTTTPTPTPTPTTVQVGLGGTTFTPDTVSIQPGDTVEWTWASSNHSVTSGTPGQPDGTFDSGIHGVPFTFSHTFATAGSFPYYCMVHGAMMVGTVNVLGPTPTPTPSATPSATITPGPAAQALNLSTRMLVLTGDNVGIGGFIITGTVPKRVLLRAVGPTLGQFGVPNPLPDPVMELHGPPGFVTIINDNCDPGSFGTPFCMPGSLDSVIQADLDPGAYSAIVRGKNDSVGVALVEIYDLNQLVASKLANLSTRAFVNMGDNIVIAGFILGGNSGDDRIVVRGIGPSLTAFGVPNALADPVLGLRDENGTLVMGNDNWEDDPVQAAELIAAGLAPTNPLESAIAVTLPPGLYSSLLSGLNNTSGVGLAEVYDRGGGTPAPTPTPGTPSPTPTPGTPTPSPTPSASPSPTATFPPPTPTPGACTENFDGVIAPALPPGWGGAIVVGDPPGWQTTTLNPDTPLNTAFVPDQDGISEKVMDSPNIAVNSAAAQIRWRNNFDTEHDPPPTEVFWDGYVLEVSINGGAFVDVTDPSVGGTFVSGGYTGEIDGTANNPLAGRMAWSGNSGGYIDTVINLPASLNGQTVKLRFRMGTDEAVAAPGVRVDTFSFTGGSCQ